ncbi:hypothetical protein PQR34_43900, partial [Paraburkholderia sediminicola]
PVAFVMSENKHRRHLTTMQLAIVVALARDWSLAQPAHRPGKGVREEHLYHTTADRAAQSGASTSTQRRAVVSNRDLLLYWR